MRPAPAPFPAPSALKGEGANASLLLQRLLALFAAGVLLFNFPLLKLWLSNASVWGLPLLPVALFGGWTLLIVLLACLLEQRPQD